MRHRKPLSAVAQPSPRLERAYSVATDAEREAFAKRHFPEALASPSPAADLLELVAAYVAQAGLTADASDAALDRRRHVASEIKRRIDALCGAATADDGVSIPSTLQDFSADE